MTVVFELHFDDAIGHLKALCLTLEVVKFFAGEVQLCPEPPTEQRHVEGLRVPQRADCPSGDPLDDDSDKDSE